MGRNDAIQIIRNAIENLSDKHQEAWNDMEIGKTKRYWDSAQTLRRYLDGFEDSQGQGIRLT